MYHFIFIISFLICNLSNASDLWTKFNVTFPINCISGDNNFIWLGTPDGIIKLNKTDGTQEKFTTQNGLADSTIKCIAVDKNGYVYAGAKNNYDGGCFSVYNGNSWTNYKKSKNGLSGNEIIDIAVDNDRGGAYIATHYYYNISSSNEEQLYNLVKNVQFFQNNEFQTIYSQTVLYDYNQHTNFLSALSFMDSLLFIGMSDNINFINIKDESGYIYFTRPLVNNNPFRINYCLAESQLKNNPYFWIKGYYGPDNTDIILYSNYSAHGINMDNFKMFYPPDGLIFDTSEYTYFIIDNKNNKWVSCSERVSANDYLVKYDDINYNIYQNPNFVHGFNITCIYADDQGYIWVGTQIDGLWRFDSRNTTAVETANQTPSSFTLSSAFPNPFNAQTTISFTLSKPSKVNLSIYSLTGQKVRELAAGNYSAGKHTAVWDGKNEKGETVSSGMYLARMESGGVSKVVRMAMVK